MRTIRALFVLPCVLLAACQMTTFETPPLAATPGCDPALVGRWGSDDGEDPPTPRPTNAKYVPPPELVLVIDAACSLDVEEYTQDGVRHGEPTRLHLARQGELRYAWVDAGWAMARFREEHRFPAGDILLMRFTLDGDRLDVFNIDDKLAAHAIIDGDLTGEVQYTDHELYNRLTGEQAPAVLGHTGLFDAEPGTFTRLAGD
jgi:hypothetical protein